MLHQNEAHLIFCRILEFLEFELIVETIYYPFFVVIAFEHMVSVVGVVIPLLPTANVAWKLGTVPQNLEREKEVGRFYSNL